MGKIIGEESLFYRGGSIIWSLLLLHLFKGMCKLFFLSCVTCCRTGRLLFLLWIVAMWLSYMEEKCHPIVRYVIMWWISNVFFIWEIHQKRKEQYLLVAWMQNIDNVFRKGIDKAVMVFKEIHERHPQARFVLAGSPGEGSRYILEQIKRLGLDDGSVTYLGAISEELKIRLMMESKFYFMLSTYEGFGIAAIEALTAGCCLIHSGRGGLKDAAGEMGVQVDIEDMESVTQTCLKLYECPVDQGEIEEGIRFVKERFCYKTRLDTIKCYL